jgi:hypothetical protein
MLAGDSGPHIIRSASCSRRRTGDVGAAGGRQTGAFAMPRFTHPKVIPISATARAVALPLRAASQPTLEYPGWDGTCSR